MINFFTNLELNQQIFVDTGFYGILPFVINSITENFNIINSHIIATCSIDQYFTINLHKISDGWFYNGNYTYVQGMNFAFIELQGKKFAMANLLFRPKFK